MLALTCGLCPPVSSRVLSSSDQAGASSSGVPSAGPHSDPAAAVHPRRADWWAVHRYVSTVPTPPRLAFAFALACASPGVAWLFTLPLTCGLSAHAYLRLKQRTHSPLASVWSDDVCDTCIQHRTQKELSLAAAANRAAEAIGSATLLPPTPANDAATQPLSLHPLFLSFLRCAVLFCCVGFSLPKSLCWCDWIHAESNRRSELCPCRTHTLPNSGYLKIMTAAPTVRRKQRQRTRKR